MNTSLHNCSDARSLTLLLNDKSNINLRDKEGNTPLHTQRVFDNIEVLLAYGANPNIRNYKLETPLHLNQDFKIIKKLLQAGADSNIPDNEGMTPLHIHQSKDIIFELLKHRAQIDTRNNYGRTPLYYSSHTELLLSCGAKIDVVDCNEQTVLFSPFLTCDNFRSILKAYIGDVKKLINRRDKYQETVFFHHRYNPEIIQLFLEYGGDPTISNSFNKLPFFECRDKRVLITLLDHLKIGDKVPPWILEYEDCYGLTAPHYLSDELKEVFVRYS